MLDPNILKQVFEAAVFRPSANAVSRLNLVLCIIGIVLFRRVPAWDVVNHMYIMPPGKRPLVAPSASEKGSDDQLNA